LGDPISGPPRSPSPLPPMKRILAASFLIIACASSAAAQRLSILPREPGDTVRYRARTYVASGVGASATIGGEMEHDAVIAVTRTGGDTARAWFEELSIRRIGGAVVGADSALGLPFLFRVSDRRVSLFLAPDLPESVGRMADLERQLADFFPTLPAGPLAPGAEWADTVVHEESVRGRFSRTVAARRYRVRGDTTIFGARAVVVEMTAVLTEDQTVDLSPRSRVARTLDARLSGREEGVVLFTPDGRFLGASRRAELTGTSTMQGSTLPLSRIQRTEIVPHPPR
jgi:hypothetical protein